MIETRGLVGAIEALDACLKAAQVRLSGMDFVTGGLVTIRVTGDVGAVNAAVSAGEAAARRVGTVVSAHVIPRPHAGIRELVYGPGTRGPAPLRPPETEIASSSEQSPGAAAPEYLSPEVPPAGEIPAEDLPAATARVREIVRGTDVEALMEDVGVLSDAPVWKLRKIARYIPNIRLSGIEISNARKEELLLEMTAAALEGGGDSDAH